MATYLCRSYRSSRLRFNKVTVFARKVQKQSHKKIALASTGRKFKSCSLKRITALSRCRKVRLSSTKLLVLIPRGVNSFTSELFLKIQFVQVVNSFKSRKLLGGCNLSNVSRFNLTSKIHRHYSVYRFLVYKTNFKPLQLFSSYTLNGVRQNADYFFIDKGVLGGVGLIAQENNSVEEILSSLLLFLEEELTSGRIEVAFYRHFKVQEKNQWFEIQSLLIKFASICPSDSLPHPHFFSF